jgi:MYXO-CTERM domain-containing protein
MMRRFFRPSASRVRLVGSISLLAALWTPMVHARTLLSADGPGMTYELIGQWYNPELPDCGHKVPHITEDFDDELGKNVFIFHAHVNLDDDRCGATDRQRTEIRAKVADVSAQNGETVYYRWKFKLPVGFQESDYFTHIFQIKSDQADPIMTLSPRSGTFSIGGRIGTHASNPVSKFIGFWVVVDLKVLFSNSGNIAMTIRRISTGETLLSYSGNVDMWDDGSGSHDSKFGIYRSLDGKSMLRDEQVRFADFCTSKVSAAECDDGLGLPDAGVRDAGGALDAVAPMDAGQSGSGAGGAAGGGTGGNGGAGGAGGGSGAGGAGGGVGEDAALPPAGGAGGSPPADAGHSGPMRDGGAPARPDDLQAGCACHLDSSGGAPRGALLWLGVAGGAFGWVRRRRRRSDERG